MEGRNVN